MRLYDERLSLLAMRYNLITLTGWLFIPPTEQMIGLPVVWRC